ncbi:hypothetical protein TNCV_3111391 [Trichonephila clavipes]|nr:hypothetical protein TNCV_3111391 [Trichonephila clavipes]
MSSSLGQLKTLRVGERHTLNLSMLKHPPVGVEVKREGASSGSSSSVDYGSKLREVDGLDRQINLEVDCDDGQELLNFHNQELTNDKLIDIHWQEQDIEKLESF